MTTYPRIAALALASLLIPAVQAETLLEVYEAAVRSDPLLREAEANRLAVLESKPQARAALLPQVDARATLASEKSDGSNVFAQVDQNTGELFILTREFEGTQDTTNWTVELRQSVFRWDQWVRLRQSDKFVAQAEVDYRAAGQDLMLRVSEAYFNVLAAQDALAAEQGSKEAIARQLEQAQKRFEVGLIAITDVQEAQAAYDQSIAAEILAKRTLANAREALREITGQYTAQLAGPRGEFPLVAPEPSDEGRWVEIALEQNLGLLSADIGADITRDDIRIARTGHYPTVDLVASRSDVDVVGEQRTAIRFGAATPPLSDPQPADFQTTNDSIALQFSLPIFSGGGVSSQVREAVYRHRAAKERLERVARETERQTRDSYLGVISEISRVKALRQALESAQTALKATEAGFEVGTRTTVDVLAGRQQLLAAETEYARSRYDYILNVLRLKQAAGTLTVQDLARVNTWLDTSSG